MPIKGNTSHSILILSFLWKSHYSVGQKFFRLVIFFRANSILHLVTFWSFVLIIYNCVQSPFVQLFLFLREIFIRHFFESWKAEKSYQKNIISKILFYWLIFVRIWFISLCRKFVSSIKFFNGSGQNKIDRGWIIVLLSQ